MSDKDILCMMAENNPKAWDCLYDKYGAAMYTITYKLAGDNTIAEKIFIDAFIELHEKQILANVTNGLHTLVLRHTYNFAIIELEKYGIRPSAIKQALIYEVIDLLCTKCSTIQQVASHLSITETGATKKLQNEFCRLRTQNSNTICNANHQTILLQQDYFKNSNN